VRILFTSIATLASFGFLVPHAAMAQDAPTEQPPQASAPQSPEAPVETTPPSGGQIKDGKAIYSSGDVKGWLGEGTPSSGGQIKDGKATYSSGDIMGWFNNFEVKPLPPETKDR